MIFLFNMNIFFSISVLRIGLLKKVHKGSSALTRSLAETFRGPPRLREAPPRPSAIFLRAVKAPARPSATFLRAVKAPARPSATFLRAVKAPARPSATFLRAVKAPARPSATFLRAVKGPARPSVTFRVGAKEKNRALDHQTRPTRFSPKISNNNNHLF